MHVDLIEQPQTLVTPTFSESGSKGVRAERKAENAGALKKTARYAAAGCMGHEPLQINGILHSNTLRAPFCFVSRIQRSGDIGGVRVFHAVQRRTRAARYAYPWRQAKKKALRRGPWVGHPRARRGFTLGKLG